MVLCESAKSDDLIWTTQVLQSLTQQALALGAEKLELQEMLAQQGRELDDALGARDAASAAASAAAARAKALSRQARLRDTWCLSRVFGFLAQLSARAPRRSGAGRAPAVQPGLA